MHIAVDTLGHLLALTVTPADQGDRDQVAPLAEQVQQVTGIDGGTGLRRPGLHRTQTPPTPHNSTAYGSKWSSTRWPNEASCSCRADGSLNEASPGPRASDASHETTNGSHKPSKEYTSSPSPSS